MSQSNQIYSFYQHGVYNTTNVCPLKGVKTVGANNHDNSQDKLINPCSLPKVKDTITLTMTTVFDAAYLQGTYKKRNYT